MKIIIILLLVLSFTAFIYGEKIAVIKEINNPNPFFNSIIVDGEQLIITDGLNILIYSLKDFKLKKKFGKHGEGPREFMGFESGKFVATEVNSDNIFVSSIKKVTYFSKEGDYIKEIKLNNSAWWYKPLSNGFIGLDNKIENKTEFDTINLYDNKFNKIKELFNEKKYIQQNKKINLIAYKQAYPIINKNKIFINNKNGTFNVYNYNGKKLYDIAPDFKKYKILKKHKKATFNMLKTDPRTKQYYELVKSRLVFSEYFPVMRNYNISNGKLYILTYYKKDGKSEFIIMDIKGKYIKTKYIPISYNNIVEASPYTINNEKIYQLIENSEEENWELHITPIR